MKLVFVLFDSLNRRALSSYGGSLSTPNFERLAEKSIVFDSHYVGSLPCMPARRDFHTGRLNFLHRSWGPLEPFDESFPARLRDRGVYSHLVSDHYHYFEDGGATFHTRYTTWDFIRGQESDPWTAMVKPTLDRFRELYHGEQFENSRNGHRLQGMINRTAIVEESDFPCVQCFDSALRFLDANSAEDSWLLHLEAFDPHEPFVAPRRFREKLATDYEGPILDWPRYRPVEEDEAEVAELQANYAALVSLCDDQLGRLLDAFDTRNLWDDTAIIMTTDHGFMLSEHDWWAKNRMPCYNEISNVPFFLYHPDLKSRAGNRVTGLSQAIDVMPTILDMFGVLPSSATQGTSLMPLASGQADHVRDIALYGIFAGAINATDGRYTYFRYPENMETHDLYEYTLMPMHNRSLFEARELRQATLYGGFDFTDGVPLLKVPALADAKRSPRQGGFADTETVLYDLLSDPGQENPIQLPEIEARLCRLIAREMIAHDAPAELFQRFALSGDG